MKYGDRIRVRLATGEVWGQLLGYDARSVAVKFETEAGPEYLTVRREEVLECLKRYGPVRSAA